MSTTSKAPPPPILNIALTARQVTLLAGIAAVLLVVLTAFITRHAVHARSIVLSKDEWRCSNFREKIVQERERTATFLGATFTYMTTEERDACIEIKRSMR